MNLQETLCPLNKIFAVFTMYEDTFSLISRSSDYNISQLDSSSKRCMCRKGFRLLDPDINKEQFRCIRNVDPGLNQDHMLSSEIVHPSASPQNFKVQVLQGELLVT